MTDNYLPNQEQLKEIIKPHAHDVLSGRGNFVNHHSGNENFRKLVKHHKKAYVACPKSQKAIYSKIIYDEIRAMNPAGRFLKQDPKTKLWSDIGEKKALDKTRQALREGAPELLKELETGVPGGDGTGGNNNGEDFVAPLRISRNGHPLAESLLGNISLGSFSLGSFNNGAGASFTTAGAGNGNGASFSGVPSQVGMGDNTLMYNAQGTNSILAAAAQLQAQQQAIQQQQQSQNSTNPAQWEAQLEILKAQMQMNSQQANNMAAAAQVQQQQQQQGGAGGTGGDNNNNMANNQNSGFNAMLVAAQQASMGSNEVTALLAAIHNGATGNNVSSGGMGMGNNNLYQQQLAQAQAAMFMSNNNMSNSSSMNGSQGTLVTGNLNNMNNNIGQMNNNSISNNTNSNSANNRGGNSSGNGSTFGSAVGNNNNQQHQVSFSSIASQNQQQQRQNQQGQNTNELRQNDRSQEQQQHFQGGYGEQSFNVCVPLKPSSDDNLLDNPTPLETPGQHNRRNMRGGGNLNSSFTRAQRIGLKNSFTRRPNRHMRNPDIQSSLKNSLMSIESLTLDDIDSSEFSGGNMEGVFDESETESKGSNMENGHGKHGHGPHDMSDMSKMSEVSEL